MHAIHLSNLRCSEVLMMEKEFAQRRCIYKWLLKICLTGFSELKVFLKFYAVHILGRGLCDISVRECHTHWVAPRLMDWLTACRAQPGNWVVVQLNYHNEFERDQNLSKVLLRSYARALQYLSLEEWYTISIRLDPSHPNISMHILHNIF